MGKPQIIVSPSGVYELSGIASAATMRTLLTRWRQARSKASLAAGQEELLSAEEVSGAARRAHAARLLGA